MLDKAITIKLDAETARQIEQVAMLAERPTSQVTRMMIKARLAEHGPTLAAIARPKIHLLQEMKNENQSNTYQDGNG